METQEKPQTIGIDLSELALYSEPVPVDPEANMDDRAPLPPDTAAGYLAIPKLLPLKDDPSHFIKKDSTGKLQLTVEWEIQDEGQPWHKTRVKSYPSCRVNRARTTEIDQLLKAWYGPQTYAKQQFHLSPEGAKVKAVYDLAASGRPLRIVTEWRAEYEDPSGAKDKSGKYAKTLTLYYGMKKFPSTTGADGQPVYHEITEHPVSGAPVRTSIQIVSYLPA